MSQKKSVTLPQGHPTPHFLKCYKYPKTKLGSLKSLEYLLASRIDAEKARKITGALFGIYELRLADAHLPADDFQESFALLEINRSLPTVIQGYQLLDSCVSSLYEVIDVLQNWDKLNISTI